MLPRNRLNFYALLWLMFLVLSSIWGSQRAGAAVDMDRNCEGCSCKEVLFLVKPDNSKQAYTLPDVSTGAVHGLLTINNAPPGTCDTANQLKDNGKMDIWETDAGRVCTPRGGQTTQSTNGYGGTLISRVTPMADRKKCDPQ